MPDADPAFAADALLGAAFGSAGERCMAISAVVAVGSIGDPFAATLGQLARGLQIGPGSAEGMDMGPLVTAAHRDRVKSHIDGGIKEGARLVVDGRGVKVPGHEAGFFLGPTIFDAVTPDMTIYTDEIFGPVLVVLRVETLDEAIDVVNRNPYGNGTAIFTNSGGAAEKFEEQVEVGMVGVNVPDSRAERVLFVRREAVAVRRPARTEPKASRFTRARRRHDAVAQGRYSVVGIHDAHNVLTDTISEKRTNRRK